MTDELRDWLEQVKDGLAPDVLARLAEEDKLERTPYWAITPEGNYQWMWRG